jgi:hypothetical protein
MKPRPTVSAVGSTLGASLDASVGLAEDGEAGAADGAVDDGAPPPLQAATSTSMARAADVERSNDTMTSER